MGPVPAAQFEVGDAPMGNVQDNRVLGGTVEYVSNNLVEEGDADNVHLKEVVATDRIELNPVVVDHAPMIVVENLVVAPSSDVATEEVEAMNIHETRLDNVIIPEAQFESFF